MNKARENLKEDIEKINDELTIEKVRIFIMGILAQQRLDQPLNKENQGKRDNQSVIQ